MIVIVNRYHHSRKNLKTLVYDLDLESIAESNKINKKTMLNP